MFCGIAVMEVKMSFTAAYGGSCVCGASREFERVSVAEGITGGVCLRNSEACRPSGALMRVISRTVAATRENNQPG